ncbi:MAG: Hsp20/alpha crystallin family protein [Desulfuromusa sp.]|nr:Hsp20/alpha crystallin family protein [Desulfuromusa sp.]
MATWQQLREGVGRAWGSLVEGWHQLQDRASGAMTRFVPGASKMYPTEQEHQEILHRNSGWGVLAAEVFDDTKKVVVRLEAPGLEADEIDLQVINNMLVVRGEKSLQREQEAGQYHIIECAYGSFERAIPLPADVDPDATKASYKRGILRIELPKINGQKKSKIKVLGS